MKRKSTSDPEQIKKSRTMPDPQAEDGVPAPEKDALAELKAMMQGLSAQMSGVSVDIVQVKKDLGAQIEKGNKATDDLRERMDRNDATFADRVRAVMDGLPADQSHQSQSTTGASVSGSSRASYASCLSSTSGSASGSAPSCTVPPGPTRDEMYWLCRRSLRIWPVPGPDLRRSLGEFMKNRLHMSPATLFSMGEVSVKRAFLNPRSKLKDEVVAVFSSQEIRDVVRRSARELAGDENAGIRLEIPRALQNSLKSLEAVSYALKKKNPEMKRSIKFDDDRMDLVLDFCLDPDNGAPWRKLHPEQAK